MIWLTWRQHRKQALFGLIGLAILGAVLIPTGLQMYHALETTGLSNCLSKFGTGDFVKAGPNQSCDGAAERFNNDYGARTYLAVLLAFLPLLVGLFWGAPLVAREVEQNTHRLAWTQGVTRRRWAVVKFSAILAGSAIVAAGYAWLTSWWVAPLAQAGTGRFRELFDVQGIAPIGYTLFAVALGIFAGTVVRKVLPAMAITLVAFVGARAVVSMLVRPNFQAPLTRKFPVVSESMPNPTSGDWVMSYGIYDGKDNLIAASTGGNCHPSEADLCGGLDRFNVQTYQPGSRFWLFQYLEAGMFLTLAVVLLLLALHIVRRRIA